MNALILSSNISSYSAARLKQELVKRDHQVQVCSFNCYPIGENDGLPRELRGYQFDFVFPRLGAHRRLVSDQFLCELERQGIHCLNSYEAMRDTQSKYRIYQILAEHDLPLPKTWIAKGIEGFKEVWMESEKSELVIKGIRGAHGNSIYFSPNLETAERILNLPEFVGSEYLIQEFISESMGEDIRAIVVGDRVVAAISRTDESMHSPSKFPLKGHVSPEIKLEPIHLKPSEEIIAVEAARALNLDVAGVNLIRSRAGTLILEVNSSPGLEGIESVTAQNIAGQIVEHAEMLHYLLRRKKRSPENPPPVFA